MNSLIPVFGSVAILLSPLASPVAAAPAGAGGPAMVCTRSGHVSLTPGLIATEAREVTFTERGEFSNCKGPDGKVRSTEFAHKVGTGSGACGSAALAVPRATLTWNTGESSIISAAATTYGAVALVTGKVLSGLFAGAQLEATAYVVGVDDPSGCFTTGLREIDYVGEIRFEMPN